MHSFWPPPPAKTAGLTATNSNAQQLSAAEHLHYQQLFRQHQLYQQQIAASGNPYQMTSYDQFYKNGYLHALASQQAFASMANNLMNGTTAANQSTSSINSGNNTNSIQQPNVNTLLNQATTSNGSTNAGQSNSTTTDALSNSTSLAAAANPLSFAAAYNAHQQQLEQTSAALRAASASSLQSAFQFNSKKRALSSASPYPDMTLIDSVLRCSPSSLVSSLVSASSRSPSATGSMGHLPNTLSPSFNSLTNPFTLISSPSLFPQSPLGLPTNSPSSGANTPNSLSALTSLSNLNGYNSLLANNHHSAFTPHSGLNQNNLQLHYHNLFMPKMDYNGNSSSLSNQNNGQTVLTKSPLCANATSNLLFKNSTVELSPVSNPNSNSPKANLTNSTNGSLTTNGSDSANNNNATKKHASSNEHTSSDEVVSSTSLEQKKSKCESASSGSSPNNGLSSSRSSQHSDSSDIVITNSTKEELSESTPQATCCLWIGCGPLEFNDHMELVKHVTNEHINKDKKAPHICRWPDCPRKLKPFKANYMLDVHIRCHTGYKPHSCKYPDCKKMYSRRENLKTHERTHTGEFEVFN